MSRCAQLVVITLVACQSTHRPAPVPTRRAAGPDPGPPVDPACLERARDGTLLDTLPAEAAGFRITRTETGARMTRSGRAISVAEGKALWQLFSQDYFARGGMTSGGHALYSTGTCPGVGHTACLILQISICQRDLATIGGWLAEAAARIGASDGELGIEATIEERHGPPCRRGAACTPQPHYSTSSARYDPDAPRRLDEYGRGRCSNDGDCGGGSSNTCSSWWIDGVEFLIYIQHSKPTFCGCVEGYCAWFQQ